MTNPFRPEKWDEIPGFEFTDITYHRARDVAAVRIAFNRPEVRNAFRPHTVDELIAALEHARTSADISSCGAAIPGGGYGLLGLAERTDLVGGRIEHGIRDEVFQLEAWMPW